MVRAKEVYEYLHGTTFCCKGLSPGIVRQPNLTQGSLFTSKHELVNLGFESVATFFRVYAPSTVMVNNRIPTYLRLPEPPRSSISTPQVCANLQWRAERIKLYLVRYA